MAAGSALFMWSVPFCRGTSLCESSAPGLYDVVKVPPAFLIAICGSVWSHLSYLAMALSCKGQQFQMSLCFQSALVKLLFWEELQAEGSEGGADGCSSAFAGLT